MKLLDFVEFVGIAHSWISINLRGEIADGVRRVGIAAACFDLAVEHAAAVHDLLARPSESQMPGSAMALVRPVFEVYVRGLWLHRCASEIELRRYTEDARIPEIAAMIAALEAQEEFRNGALSRTKDDAWVAMCGYLHGGSHATARRFDDGVIAPCYPDEVLRAGLHYATHYGLRAAMAIAQMLKRDDLAGELLGYARMLEALPVQQRSNAESAGLGTPPG